MPMMMCTSTYIRKQSQAEVFGILDSSAMQSDR